MSLRPHPLPVPLSRRTDEREGWLRAVAAVIDILCNALSGAGPAWRNADSAQFYMAIDIDAFIDREDCA